MRRVDYWGRLFVWTILFSAKLRLRQVLGNKAFETLPVQYQLSLNQPGIAEASSFMLRVLRC